MPLFKTRAIVLRTLKLSETDKLVTLFSETYGKIKCVAKAARRLKSRFGASLEPMTYLSLIYFGKETQEIYRLNQCDIIQSYQSVREDPTKFYTSIYFIELVEAMIGERHPEPEIFHLLVSSLSASMQLNVLDNLCRLFEIRLLALAGYKPRLSLCLVCKKESKSPWVGFSFSKQGIICQPCQNSEIAEAKLQSGTLNYLKKMLTFDISRSDRLKIPKGVEKELEYITHRLVLSRLGRELKSYPLIKQMEKVYY